MQNLILHTQHKIKKTIKYKKLSIFLIFSHNLIIFEKPTIF